MWSGRILTAAARKLGCASCTVYEYSKRYPALQDVVGKARESTILKSASHAASCKLLSLPLCVPERLAYVDSCLGSNFLTTYPPSEASSPS